MKATSDDRRLLRMEEILAVLLRYGAIVACGWIALGMALGGLRDVLPPTSIPGRCLEIGIVLLIALPVLRVALMTGVFLLERDYLFVAISGAVLVIIVLGFLLGTLNHHFSFPEIG